MARCGDPGLVRAVRAAVQGIAGLDAVADDAALTVLQRGAIAWIAHSKLSNTWRSPPTMISIVLSYSLPHTSQLAIGCSSRAGSR
jgi:hypothetical protein